MADIDWNQKRIVFRNTETGEFYVRVETGYMLVEDYIEGGRVELEAHVRPLERVGQFTNVQIQNGDYDTPPCCAEFTDFGVCGHSKGRTS